MKKLQDVINEISFIIDLKVIRMNFEKVFKNTNQLSILFIEDNQKFRQETTEIFNQIFKKVDIASNGEDALIQYNKFFQENNHHYDLIISDICMPIIDGVALTKQIYNINPEQIVIILSAHTESKYLLEFVNLGVEHFLLKPIDYEHMLKVFYNTSIKILTKNDNSQTDSKIIQLGQNYYWDNKNNNLFHKDHTLIKLTHKELLLMELFIKNGRKITAVEEIFNLLWEDNTEMANKENLKPIISRLRKKITLLPIESIYNLGYRLIF